MRIKHVHIIPPGTPSAAVNDRQMSAADLVISLSEDGDAKVVKYRYASTDSIEVTVNEVPPLQVIGRRLVRCGPDARDMFAG